MKHFGARLRKDWFITFKRRSMIWNRHLIPSCYGINLFGDSVSTTRTMYRTEPRVARIQMAARANTRDCQAIGNVPLVPRTHTLYSVPRQKSSPTSPLSHPRMSAGSCSVVKPFLGRVGANAQKTKTEGLSPDRTGDLGICNPTLWPLSYQPTSV